MNVCPKCNQPATRPLVQVVNGGNVRIDPSVIPDIVAWITARAAQLAVVARGEQLGMSAEPGPTEIGVRYAATRILMHWSVMIELLSDEMPLKHFEEAKAFGTAAPLPMFVSKYIPTRHNPEPPNCGKDG